MKVLYFCSYDGNSRGVFSSEVLANEWKKNEGCLAFVTEVKYDDGFNIIEVDGQHFEDFIESLSDKKGSIEFERVKNNLLIEWKFKHV